MKLCQVHHLNRLQHRAARSAQGTQHFHDPKTSRSGLKPSCGLSGEFHWVGFCRACGFWELVGLGGHRVLPTPSNCRLVELSSNKELVSKLKRLMGEFIFGTARATMHSACSFVALSWLARACNIASMPKVIRSGSRLITTL